MKPLRALVVLAGVAAFPGCDYESPGGVADESVWSPVPADSSEGDLPEREGRVADIAALEARTASLQARLDEASPLAPEPEPAAGRAQRVSQLQGELRAAREELREMRDLTSDGESFRQRRERVEALLADVETRLSAVEGEARE